MASPNANCFRIRWQIGNLASESLYLSPHGAHMFWLSDSSAYQVDMHTSHSLGCDWLPEKADKTHKFNLFCRSCALLVQENEMHTWTKSRSHWSDGHIYAHVTDRHATTISSSLRAPNHHSTSSSTTFWKFTRFAPKRRMVQIWHSESEQRKNWWSKIVFLLQGPYST